MKLQKAIESINIKAILLIAFFYFLAFGITLFNDGLFFDDWLFYNIDHANFMPFMVQYGNPWLGWYHNFAFLFDNILLSRFMIFCCYLFAAFCLYGALKTIKEISSKEKLLITLFFALFPVNFVRVLFCLVHYATSYFLFFLGFFLLSRYFIKRNIFLRISALLCLFLSFFSLQSLLVFYVVIILFIIYMEHACIKTTTCLLSLSIKYIDFIVAPVVFWSLRNIFFKPYGLYEAYNVVNPVNLFKSIYYIPVTFITSFITPLDQAFQFLYSNPAMIIIFTLLISRLVHKKYFSMPEKAGVNDVWLLGFGVLAFAFGAYGYLAVNKIPASCDAWSGRYQMLIPLGASFIIVYLVRIFFNNGKARILAYSLLIVLFVYANFTGYLKYQQDWFKELSLIENFRESEILKNNASFTFNDKTVSLNARNRIYGWSEYAALMKHAFGDERRFGAGYLREDFFKDIETIIPQGQYNIREYKMQKPQYEVTIDYGEYRPTNKGIIGLMWLRFAKPDLFENRIRNLIKLQYKKL